MALLFSTVNAAVENDNVDFVVGGIPRDEDDLFGWRAHVCSFGIDITKLFKETDSETAENTGMFKDVKFKVQNKTDGYWVTAERNDAEGVYYVTGHVEAESDATAF